MNRLLTSLAFAIALLSIGWPVLESSAQYAVAQTTGVSHEITSWNLDGTITVAVCQIAERVLERRRHDNP